jgi:hypothetical protein
MVALDAASRLRYERPHHYHLCNSAIFTPSWNVGIAVPDTSIYLQYVMFMSGVVICINTAPAAESLSVSLFLVGVSFLKKWSPRRIGMPLGRGGHCPPHWMA